jgi:NADH dehydrogenase [ubiquinone] 1 alpha subcomplex assembly factor 5
VTITPSASTAGPFDRKAFLRQRNRAAEVWREYYRAQSHNSSNIDPTAPDFLIREVAARLSDRLLDINRHYENALDIGCHRGQMAEVLPPDRVGALLGFDRASGMVAGVEDFPTFIADEEAIPIADNSMDLVMSCLNLQWVNDLPGALMQIRRILKPDGLFLAAIVGGNSLTELRQCLLQAETEIAGGVSPRVLPMIDMRDAGALLQRAGFALPVVDVDNLTFEYSDPFALMRELRGLGWQNALAARRKSFTARAIMTATAENYVNNHASDAGLVPATFEILYLTAWAPHESQQKPLAPGSGQTPLHEALE